MLGIEVAARTDTGRRRDHNEDHLGNLLLKQPKKYSTDFLQERGYLFAVADGMGGHEGGEVASELAITNLFETYYAETNDILPALEKAITAANSSVYSHNDSNGPSRRSMGTTLTVVLLRGNRALIGNVGDSRIYLIRQGVATRLTRDHSLVEEQLAIGAITEEQAKHSLVKNVITRAIGNQAHVEADFFEHEVGAGDTLLLCSDGLYNMVDDPLIGSVVATERDLDKAALELIRLANEAGGTDNISAILVRVKKPGDPIPSMLEGYTNAGNAVLDKQVTDQITAQMPVTEPSVSPVATIAPPAAQTQPSLPVTHPENRTPPFTTGAIPTLRTESLRSTTIAAPRRSRGLSPVIRVLALVLGLIVLAGLAYVLLNNGNEPAPAAATATQPATQTITASTATLSAATALPTTLPVAASAPPTVTRQAAAPTAANAPNIPVTGTIAPGNTAYSRNAAQEIRFLIQNYPADKAAQLLAATLSLNDGSGKSVRELKWDTTATINSLSCTLDLSRDLADGDYVLDIPQDPTQPTVRGPKTVQITVTVKNDTIGLKSRPQDAIFVNTETTARLFVTVTYS